MAEVDAGRLTLDHTLDVALPGFVGPGAQRIRVLDLLQHTSGLPDPDGSPPDPDGIPGFYRERGSEISHSARARGFCAGPLRAEPGAQFHYNNCDYLLLGAILERASGLGYEALVRSRLGLAGVRLASDGEPVGLGVMRDYAQGSQAPPMNLATYGAAGALTGSAGDLVAFNRVLIDRQLLSESATERMWRSDPALGYAALGAWSFPAPLRGCAQAVQLVERRGAIGGLQVRNLIAPELRQSLVVLTNQGDFEFGEIWRGEGWAFEFASAAFCRDASRGP